MAADSSRASKALDAIADARTLLDGFLEHSPVAFQVYSADGQSIYVNRAFHALFGSEPPRDYSVFHDVQLQKQGVLEGVRRAFAGETVRIPMHAYDPRDNERVRVESGGPLALEATLLPLRSREGDQAVQHVAVFFKDVTALAERDRLEVERTRELREANETAESATRELEAFSYSVAHDLRAPLRGIEGFCVALKEDCGEQLDAAGRAHLDRIRASTKRMGQLLDALLSLSRLTRSEVFIETVDLSALSHRILRRLKDAQPERPVETRVEEGLIVEGDSQLLGAAMEHLLNNAWKFTRKQPSARIEVGRESRDGAPVFFVRDNGVGFDMAYSSKLFGVFQRLHGVSEFEGSGIGLATVQRIIRRHGGAVWARGEVGGGATVFFTLRPS